MHLADVADLVDVVLLEDEGEATEDEVEVTEDEVDLEEVGEEDVSRTIRIVSLIQLITSPS